MDDYDSTENGNIDNMMMMTGEGGGYYAHPTGIQPAYDNGVDDYYLDDDNDIIDYDDGDVEIGHDLGEEEEDEFDFVTEPPSYPETPEQQITRHEQLKMIHLRSHLNQLTEKVQEHEYLTEKTREEIKKCRSNMTELEAHRDQVFSEIQNKESEGNISALYRLRSQHDRLCQELANEQELEKIIAIKLEQAEYELSKVKVERGRFLLAEDDLIKKEQQLAGEKTEIALQRLKKEEMYAMKAHRLKRNQERTNVDALRERERKQQVAIEGAQKSKEKAKKYLDDTLSKIRQREAEENERQKSDMERKMNMLLKLKSDITANRENLKAVRNKSKTIEKEAQNEEMKERERIIKSGGNPDEAILIKKRLNELEKQKEQFEYQKKDRQAEIMQKILIEEERMKRRRKQHPYLFSGTRQDKSKNIGPHRKKPLKIFQEASELSLLSDMLQPKGIRNEEKGADTDQEKDELMDDQMEDELERIADSSDSSLSASEEEIDADLAKPEFEGLWNEHKPYKIPDESGFKLPGATKMQKEIMQQVLEKHRAGIIQKQVAAGREFSGCPFYSKPGVIHFKDFDVGKSYKKKVALTNVSYTVNYCKFVGITERLKDFIDIHFDPPGQMSAGLTCEMLVTFKPMINEDLTGEVNFLSQTGPFSVPLKCTTKKCDLSVDNSQIEFGTSVIGETLKQTFTLTNKGALGTKFEFFKVTGMKPRTSTSAITSLGRLTTGDTMRAVSPDTTDIADKPKKDISHLLDKTDTKKKTSDDVTKEQPVQEPGVVENGEQQSSDAKITGDGNTEEYGGTQLSAIGEEQRDTDQDIVTSPDIVVSSMEDFGTLDGMSVGSVPAGEIGPLSSVKLEIIWQPTISGNFFTEFLVNFSDPLSENISVHTSGTAIDVPVWVERQNVDLKICLFDRLYQDTIIVNNRATTALRLKFEVCKELKNHLELLPKTGYIQAQSQFSAQLKFLPRHSLGTEAEKYFDKETGVLEVPLTIRVADQTQPVMFTLHAIVTNSDMEFDISEIDFGCCTIYESVKTSVRLTNKSILPQEYGFVSLPDYVEVQPNDGFGTLLPLESIQLDVLFSPKKAKEYKFQLTCKSLINRDFKIQCEGIGVHPPLNLSSQVVHFKATPMYDVSTTAIHVINNHTSTNEFTHPVPRIGKGEIAPVGPTSFEFVLPENAPLTISPSVGNVEPGKKLRVELRFTPNLNEEDIKTEAVRMAVKMLEAKAEKDYQNQLKHEKEMQEQENKKNAAGKKNQGKEKASPKPKGKPGAGSATPTLTVSGPKQVVAPDSQSITKDSPEYSAAISSLLRQFKGDFNTFIIPCYIATGKCCNPGELPYSVHNTLYLEVHCPTVKPPVVVISDNGKSCLDFGQISIGQTIVKSVTIQNISDRTVELNSTVLNTCGPFIMLNALRVLSPDATHTMLISYTPTESRIFYENLEINSGTATLHITLNGRGVSPLIDLSLDGTMFDMGSVLSNEWNERTFKMQNTSTLSIDYAIKLDSLSLLRHSKSQGLPGYLHLNGGKTYVGTQNYNGQNVFDLTPAEGTIPAGGTKEVNVTFAPDHQSDHYSDGVRIELFGQEETHFFNIKGVAKNHVMYVSGGDEREPPVESLAVVPSPQETEEDSKTPAVVPVLLTLYSKVKDDEFVAATREIFVGCVRTMAVSQKKPGEGGKKNGEFQFENVQQATSKGFSIDPQRGMVEAGVEKTITITWKPPAGHNPNTTVDTSVMITLKGDVTEQVRLLIKAMVVS